METFHTGTVSTLHRIRNRRLWAQKAMSLLHQKESTLLAREGQGYLASSGIDLGQDMLQLLSGRMSFSC
eukprot:scaffold210328_cov23-Tisochrysis_lutea.AAC.1